MLTAIRRALGFRPTLRLPSDDDGFFPALDQFQLDAFRCLRFHYPERNAEPFCKLLALKAANAFAAGYHFRNRHSALASRPVQLQIDPMNNCQLRCPSCVHSANTAWTSRFDWPSASLEVGEFDRFCNEFGPFATSIALFRDGEPLLHRRFPEFVTIARSHLLHTVTSTNLSMRLDAEALVASGLDRLVAGIDGASAATYSRYRRGGNFELVLDNLRAIVRARKAQANAKPWLVWQFLAFEHNAHEVEAVTELARATGVDQLVIARPHSVEHDDPEIKVAMDVPFGEILFAEPQDWCQDAERISVTRNAERIDQLFGESWVDRSNAVDGLEHGPGQANSTCGWLYTNLTMDAAQRITPCCLPPMRSPEPRHLVFANFKDSNAGAVVNSPDAVLARRECRSGRIADAEPQPYCVTCSDNPQPPVWPDIARYLASVDARRGLPRSVHSALAESPLYARRARL